MGRLTLDDYFTQMADLASKRATCPRRQVGAILTNSLGHVLATGYNGPPRGTPHCIDTPCPGANLPSGTGLDKCDAVHAEENALLQCKDVNEIDTAYVTTAPCLPCTRKLLNTSCRRIVFLKPYAASHSDSEVKWKQSGREWVHYQPPVSEPESD